MLGWHFVQHLREHTLTVVVGEGSSMLDVYCMDWPDDGITGQAGVTRSPGCIVDTSAGISRGMMVFEFMSSFPSDVIPCWDHRFTNLFPK